MLPAAEMDGKGAETELGLLEASTTPREDAAGVAGNSQQWGHLSEDVQHTALHQDI